MQLSAKSIDLIETQKAYKVRYKKAGLSRDKFGLPIVKAAHEAIGRHGMAAQELVGIKRTLLALTENLKKRDYIWAFPLFSKPVFSRGPFGALHESEEIELLVESLIATVLKYRSSLWEFDTNLAQILLYELTCGFERHCDWINRGVPIEAKMNELTTLVDVEPINTQLLKESERRVQ